jgi:hypothetical protein
VQLNAGYHTINVDERRVPNTFDPASAKPVKVFVSPEGKAEPSKVVFTFERLVLETPIPIGENVYRYAKVTSSSVAFRNEPSTSGGNKTVIKRLGRSDKVYVLQELVNAGNTVLVIEHNLDVIKVADHIIDLGPEGGDGGGYVVATGTPEEVAQVEGSYTGQYLKRYLEV